MTKRIPEEYIQYAWRYKRFAQHDLKTSDGQELRIIHPGRQNYDAGPDFNDARIVIGDQEWVGHVEIHFKSSDWESHGHQTDTAYDAIILHVVILNDREVLNTQGNTMATLVLGPYLSEDHFDGYKRFISSKSWVSCERSLSQVDELYHTQLKERMAASRLTRKSEEVLSLYEHMDSDWEQTVFTLIGKALGSKVNAMAFEQLCYALPLSVVRKHADSRQILEALFLGQAGLLDCEEQDEHIDTLQREYRFLRHKYSLRPISAVAWKHARIRPSSAPALRVVQLSRIYTRIGSLLSFLLDAEVKDIREHFKIELKGYWMEHIGLGRESKSAPKRIGDSLIDRLMINVVAPLRFAYGIKLEAQHYKDSALSLLESTKAEDNKIVRNWRGIGMQAAHALDTQAMLELKSTMCDKALCLRCVIGQQLMK